MKKCGRQPGGEHVSDMGVCPAASNVGVNGVNNGKNGGRICWAVAGTFCGGVKQGTFAEKQLSCMTCDVYKAVSEEEGLDKFQIKPKDTQAKT